MPENQDKTKPIEVTVKDLPLHCPMPDAPLWARHPRVFRRPRHRQGKVPLLRRRIRHHGRAAQGSPLTPPSGPRPARGRQRPRVTSALSSRKSAA